MTSNTSLSSISECSCQVDSPKCLRCLRLKIQAECVGIFIKNKLGWVLGGFEGDKPEEAAEVDFFAMLKAGLPEKLIGMADGVIMNDNDALESNVGASLPLFEGSAVIAAPIHPDGGVGVRVAWRDASDPFTAEELETLRCFLLCPEEKW